MDFILSCFAVVMIILLLVVFVFNRVNRTTRLDTLLLDLLLRQPNTVAFSLGYDKTKKKYKNATIGSEGSVKIRYDNYPVSHDGSLIVLKDHGTIAAAATGGGYRMTGMDTVRMICPDGYEGIECRLKPLCGPNDTGKNKPLTYTQFNGLGLYRNDFAASSSSSRRRRRATESTHPRIRVHCRANGKYELQTCPDATLLDENLRCQPYDICADRFNGFKHANRIDLYDPPLLDAEYYVCENNRSVKRKCSEGTVFSAALNNCVLRSVCYGRDDDTLPIDDHNYIQCRADTGQKIHCESGVIEQGRRLTCRIQVCEPRVFETSTNKLRYNYGEVRCVNDNPTEIFCDSATTVASPYRLIQTWATSETFEPYEGWPREVLSATEHKCVSPSDNIIINPSRIINVRWTRLMPQPHPYDLTTRRYICGANDYRVDYEKNAIVPVLPANRFIEVAQPCQSTLLTRWQLPWRNYESRVELPRDKPIALVGVTYDFQALTRCSDRLWPIKRTLDNVYCYARIYDSKENGDQLVYVVEECEDTEAPVGFADPPPSGGLVTADGDKLLTLVGYGQPESINVATAHVWYTLATGKYDIVRSRSEQLATSDAYSYESRLRVTRRSEIPCPSSIAVVSGQEKRQYGIMWRYLDKTEQRVGSTSTVSRAGVRPNAGDDDGNVNAIAPPGFYGLTVYQAGVNLTVGEYRDETFTITPPFKLTYQSEPVIID